MTLGNNDAPKFESDFQGFLAFVRNENEICFSPTRFAKVLNTDVYALALEASGLNVRNAEGIASQMQPYFRNVVRVIRAAFDLTNDVEDAIFWYLNTPLSSFGYQTPAQVVSAGKADVLLGYLLVELGRHHEVATE